MMNMNILKLQRILSHQNKLCFNVPYNDDYSCGYDSGYNAARKDLWDIPNQAPLNDNFPFSGYVDIDGKVYKCNSCEHEKIVRDIVYDNYFSMYRSTPASFYEKLPAGTLQEEYFLMKKLGFAKISSFESAPLKKILFTYNTLTWKQTDVIYPR